MKCFITNLNQKNSYATSASKNLFIMSWRAKKPYRARRSHFWASTPTPYLPTRLMSTMNIRLQTQHSTPLNKIFFTAAMPRPNWATQHGPTHTLENKFESKKHFAKYTWSRKDLPGKDEKNVSPDLPVFKSLSQTIARFLIILINMVM